MLPSLFITSPATWYFELKYVLSAPLRLRHGLYGSLCVVEARLMFASNTQTTPLTRVQAVAILSDVCVWCLLLNPIWRCYHWWVVSEWWWWAVQTLNNVRYPEDSAQLIVKCRKRLISCLIMIVIKILVVRHTTESLQPGSFSLFICGNSNKVNFLLAHHSSFCLLIILKKFDIFLQQRSLKEA